MAPVEGLRIGKTCAQAGLRGVIEVPQQTDRNEPGRGGRPVRARVRSRSQQRDRWTGGRPGVGLYLPLADELNEGDLPRLLAAATRQMERNRRRIEGL